jgi:predicted nucleic acid-binding protein
MPWNDISWASPDRRRRDFASATMGDRLAAVGRRINVNDQWIAATDVAHDLTVFTQDSDYAVLADLVVQT